MTPPDPSLDERTLRLLHGLADEAERAELAQLLAASPENRRRFLDHTTLHGMLAQQAKAGALAEQRSEFFHQLQQDAAARQPRRLLKFWLPAAAAVFVACLTAIFLLPAKAGAALDRVIEGMSTAQDRSYRIEVIEPPPTPLDPRPDRGRFPPANSLDGASLWLRGPRGFVLRQSLPNGQTRVIGSDGLESWSFRGTEPVRVSQDPERFGRAVFAKNGEIAFLDLRTQLDALKQLYQIEWLDHTASETWKLIGKRRSADQGGPREIELWFDPTSGLLKRMILRQLPRGNGGPLSLAIVLLSAEPLPPDFFQHRHHHEPERPLLQEP